VDNAEKGVAIATGERPDLVLMDIRLRGEKDGVQAATEIPQQVDVPVVYLTGCSNRLTVDRAKQTEHDGFILKPFLKRELQPTLMRRPTSGENNSSAGNRLSSSAIYSAGAGGRPFSNALPSTADSPSLLRREFQSE
jgi:CheY-like chemotaxis protein